MGKPFFILVASQKGGVGKTTIALNLAIALRYHKFSVLLVDTDIESASASEQLGIGVEGRGYADVVSGKVELTDVLFAYEPVDLYIIPQSTAGFDGILDAEDVEKFYATLAKQNYDFIIIDTPPGLFLKGIAKYLDDVAILTTSDTVSARSSYKMAMYCEKFKLEHRLIINRVGYSKFDLEREEVERIYGDVAFQVVPEDKIVSESISKRKPAFMIDRNAYFCLAIEDLANEYTLRIKSREQEEGTLTEADRETRPPFFDRLGRWIFRNR
jgi:MinD-like ATPase involved in chromosome partitioning or flagellar assembly